MGLSEPIIAELQHEAVSTRKMLERVPSDSFTWKPHEKSMTLGQLAGHVSELPSLIVPTLTMDELDFAAGGYKPFIPANASELVEKFDEHVTAAVNLLKTQSDEHLHQPWRLRSGEQVFFAGPRIAVLRGLVLSHLIHHRGQLSVYLRLLNVAVPSIYGPSADEAPTS